MRAMDSMGSLAGVGSGDVGGWARLERNLGVVVLLLVVGLLLLLCFLFLLNIFSVFFCFLKWALFCLFLN